MLYDGLDRPLHDLRVSLTDRCNFRCSYCMPAAIVGSPIPFTPVKEQLTHHEIVRLVKLFLKLGVYKVRLTGGEPLLRKDLCNIVSDISKLHGVGDLALTTNGYLLERYAKPLKSAGLQRINVSLDAVDSDVFGLMNGVGIGVQKILNGIQAADDAGLNPIKINMVVKKGVNDHCILDVAKKFKGTGKIVRFIEYMDVGTKNRWKNEDVVSSSDIVKLIDSEFPLVSTGRINGDVADRYIYADGTGEIGFISSITRTFCGSCNRARLSSTGELYTCLFSDKSLDLRSPLRSGASDEELYDMIMARWTKRSDRYSEERASRNGHKTVVNPRVEMYKIGG